VHQRYLLVASNGRLTGPSARTCGRCCAHSPASSLATVRRPEPFEVVVRKQAHLQERFGATLPYLDEALVEPKEPGRG
jgi:hypothetical protein